MYDKEQIKAECLKVINEHKLCFFDEIAIFVEPDLSTLYNWNFNQLEDIKSELRKNKISAKRELKRNWQKETAAPALQISVFKLMADEDELEKLTISKVNAKVENIGPILNEIEQDPLDAPID